MNGQIMLVFGIGDCGEGRLYADILNGKPDWFAGELYFGKNIKFQEAAGLFGGELVYPQDLAGLGFDTEQDLEWLARIHYKVSDGSFGVMADFSKKWNGMYGQSGFCIERMQGSVQYTGRSGGQYIFNLSGGFRLGNLRGNATLNLASKRMQEGSGGHAADQSRIALKSVLSLECSNMELDDFISSVSGTNDYVTLPLPGRYSRPSQMTGVKAELNLTDKTFKLWGKYQFKNGFWLDALLYFAGQNGKYVWWVGLQMQMCLDSLSENFPELKEISRFLGVGRIDAEVILSSTEQQITVPAQQMLLPVDGNTWPGEQLDLGPSEKSHTLKVYRGMTFRVKLKLSDSFLKDAVSIRGACIVSGFIPAEEGGNITLSGSAERIVFLGFIQLADFEITLMKKGDGSDFTFAAAGEVQLRFQELTLPKAKLCITLEEYPQHKKIELQGDIKGQLDHPLNFPDTVLEQVSFHAISEIDNENRSRKEVYFKGNAVVAGVSLEAKVLFAQQEPKVVEMKVGTGPEQELSISGLVHKYCGWEWKDYLDIRLYNGRIWYCAGKQKIISDGAEYSPGLHAQVDTNIFFLPAMRLSIDIDSGHRLTAGAQPLETVSFAFIQFYLREKEQEGGEIVRGPRVSIRMSKEDDKREFILHTIVSIFSAEIGEVKISVTQGQASGTLCFSERLPICGEIGFTIDDNGFRLHQCPIRKPPSVNFKIPSMDLGNGSCRIKIIEGPKIKTVPEIYSQGITLNEKGVNVQFRVVIELRSESVFSKEGGDEILELHFEDLSLEISKEVYTSFSFENFIKALGENIESIGAEILGQVISLQCFSDVTTEEGIKNLLRFLLIEGITWGINELVSYLICHGMKELIAKALAAALTSVLTSIWEGMEGVALLLGGVFGSIDLEGNFTVGRKVPEINEKEPEKNPMRPEAPTLFFEEDRLYIRWSACEKAERYCPIVTVAGKTRQLILSCVESNCEKYQSVVMGVEEGDKEYSCGAQELYRVSYGTEYRVSVYAWNREGAQRGPETAIYLLKRPENMKSRYFCMEKRLCITWDAVDRAEEYVVEVQWEEYGEIKRKKEICRADDERKINMEQETGRLVSVFVRGITRYVLGPTAVWDAFRLYDLKAPENIRGYRSDEGIAVEWGQVRYADRYRVIWRDSENSWVDVQEIRGTRTVIPIEKLRENICYRIKLQSMTEEIEGAVSQEVAVLWNLLAVPTIVELVCREDGLLDVVFEAEQVRYRQLVYPDGKAVILDDQPISCEWETGEHARVRLVEYARQGQWSKPISLKAVPMPKKVAVSVQAENLCVSWESLGKSYRYGMEIVTGDRSYSFGPLDGTRWQANLSDFEVDTALRVCLYAIDGADGRRRSAAAEVTLVVDPDTR